MMQFICRHIIGTFLFGGLILLGQSGSGYPWLNIAGIPVLSIGALMAIKFEFVISTSPDPWRE
ncbi:MAG: hypothetical protein K9K82_10150 [Desulfobacteraceae bacterium]|nr:hypothetical protein [Desulfobacteraceae bacterium]